MKNPSWGFSTRSDTNWLVLSQKKARSLKSDCTIRIAKTKALNSCEVTACTVDLRLYFLHV